MAISVSEIRKKLKGGGARPSLFEVELSLPTGASSLGTVTDFPFFCKSASLPASSINAIELPFLGRKVKIPSVDRTFEDWSVTIINDEDFAFRTIFEKWIEMMAPGKAIFTAETDYQTDSGSAIFGKMNVYQLSKDGDRLPGGAYEFVDVFPKTVSEIELNWETVDAIEDFQVTFSYQYWNKITSTMSGTNLSGDGVDSWYERGNTAS